MLFLLHHGVGHARLLSDFLLSHALDLWVRQFVVNFFARRVVHVLHMPAEVAALSECLVALGALERSHPGVLSEVVPQIAALLEDTVTAFVLTLEEQFDALCLRITHLNRFVPRVRDPGEGFHVALLLPV